MIVKNKIAFFDFCETLVNFQTADAFVDYIRINSNNNRMHRLNKFHLFLLRIRFVRIIELLTRFKYSLNKRLKLYHLKGLSLEELDYWARRFFNERIKPNIILEVLNIMLKLKREGYEIVVVSGGYDVYLKYFQREFNIDALFCTKIKCINGSCKGVISGVDCLNTNKIHLLEKYYNISNYYSIAYSDSISDLPLLRWVNKGFVVRHVNKPKWDVNEFQEIIWVK